MRRHINGNISIDGRNIPYEIITADDYLSEICKLSDVEIEYFADKRNQEYTIIGQILALKHAHYVMRRVSHSDGSVADGLYSLKERLLIELKSKSKFEFDEELIGFHW